MTIFSVISDKQGYIELIVFSYYCIVSKDVTLMMAP